MGYSILNQSNSFGGDVEFSKTQKRDAFKTQYCSDHGINLIRIPYSALNQIGNISESDT